AATATPTPCAYAWAVVPSPNGGTDYNILYHVAAVSSNDVWAVGSYAVSFVNHTMVEHWDGSAWSIVPSPNVGTNNNQLAGVAAISSNNVWAVGSYANDSDVFQTLVEHWDGSTWSVVPSPNMGTNGDGLKGVTAISSSNIWAVGYYANASAVEQTLVEHWDGNAWTIVPSPSTGTSDNILSAVAAVSSNDVW